MNFDTQKSPHSAINAVDKDFSGRSTPKNILRHLDHGVGHKFKEYAPVVLRLGISAVFLWFGITQLVKPEMLIGYVPAWAYIISPQLIVLINGIIETTLGLMLISGMWVRPVALILGVKGLIMGLSLGYNDIAVRDIGLAIAAFSVMLHGKDKYCIKKK